MMDRRGFIGALGLVPAAAGDKVNPQPCEPNFKGIGVLHFPPGETLMPSGQFINNSVVASQLVSDLRDGGILALPSVTDEFGEFVWDFRIENGDPRQVRVRRIDDGETFKNARKVMAARFAANSGPGSTRDAYVSNIAMLLHDHYGITDYETRNRAAEDILKLIFES